MTKRAVTAGKMIFLAMAMAGLTLFSGCENPTNSTGDDSNVSESSGTAADTTAPAVGNNGTLSFSGVSSDGVTVNWTAANDDTSAQANLRYLVYYSTSDNIASVTDAETNGTAAGCYAANIATKSVTGLTAGTTYYFNVIVQDEAGNKAAYTSNSQATAAAAP